MHTGPTAHLLSKTGGPGPPSTHSGKDLFGYSAILIRQTQVHYLYGGDCSFSHKELSDSPFCRPMGILQETTIFLTVWV